MSIMSNMKFRALLSFETNKYLKSTIYFTIVWIFFIFLFLSFYDVIKQSADQIEQLYATMPKELIEAFGKGMDSMASIYGYIGNQVVLYLVLSGGIFAVSMASGSIAGEIGNRNLLFLLSKPISRLQIYSAKFIAIITSLFVSNVVLLLTTIIAIKLLTKENDIDLGIFILIYLAIFLLEVFFATLTELLGSKFTSGKAIAFVSLAVIVSYLLNILSGLSEQADSLKYLSPSYYLDTAAIAVDGILRPESVLIVVLSIVFVIMGGYWFRKRDIN